MKNVGVKQVVSEQVPVVSEVNPLPVKSVEQLIPEAEAIKESLEPAASSWGK